MFKNGIPDAQYEAGIVVLKNFAVHRAVFDEVMSGVAR